MCANKVRLITQARGSDKNVLVHTRYAYSIKLPIGELDGAVMMPSCRKPRYGRHFVLYRWAEVARLTAAARSLHFLREQSN